MLECDLERAVANRLNVYPMWRGSAADAAAAFPAAQRRTGSGGALAVAAVLHDTRLALDDMDDLEAAGLLVVEVPDMLRDAREADIAQYLQEQLAALEEATRLDVAPAAQAAAASEDDFWPAAGADALDDDALLERLNDPDAQLDRF